VPPSQSLRWDLAKYFGNGLLVTDSLEDNGLAFLRIPSVASREPIEGWSIPPIPFQNSGYVVYPPGNVMAVIERKEKCVPGVPYLSKAQPLISRSFIRIHFLGLRDGSPHCAPPSNVIVWEFPPAVVQTMYNLIAITGSRVAMRVSYRGEDPPLDALIARILVWDWKTREIVRFCGSNGYISLSSPHQVLDLLSTDGSELVTYNARTTFLDEFRMVIIPSGLAITELVVFNTLIPQDRPGNLRRFRVPQEFRDWPAEIFVDHDRDLGTPNGDEALISDPAQAVLAIKLLRSSEPYALLVVRTQAFDQPYSEHEDLRIVPWAEWGRYVVALRVPALRASELFTLVHGAQVMVVRVSYSSDWYREGRPCYHVHAFDFGRGSPLPLRCGDNWTGWMVWFEDGVSFRFESDIDMRGKNELMSLSDGSLFHLVSCLPQPRGSEVVGSRLMIRGFRVMETTRTPFSESGNFFEDPPQLCLAFACMIRTRCGCYSNVQANVGPPTSGVRVLVLTFYSKRNGLELTLRKLAVMRLNNFYFIRMKCSCHGWLRWPDTTASYAL